MKVRLTLTLQGGFGNQMFQYAFAKAYAERHGLTLCCNWPDGEALFKLEDAPAVDGFVRASETTVLERIGDAPKKDIELRGYFQQQRAMIYTRADARRWFTFRPEVLELLVASYNPKKTHIAHRRVGDYFGYGYVVVSRKSYEQAMSRLWFVREGFAWLHGHGPNTPPEDQSFVLGLPEHLGFMRDFFTMMRATVLFRSNSTFAWWAATLGHAEIYSPVIEGLDGGKEQDCTFVVGNHPRFANLDFVTDLTILP